MARSITVMFDSNVWEKVVSPHDYPSDPNQSNSAIIHDAIAAKIISPYICETVFTIEAFPKRDRFNHGIQTGHLRARCIEKGANGNTFKAQMEFGGIRGELPALHPVLSERFEQAIKLGFKVVPTSRFGTILPKELDREDAMIPLTQEQQDDIWGFLEEKAAIHQRIEDMGVGHTVIRKIAAGYAEKLNWPVRAWYDGLHLATSAQEKKHIAAAFAEWADGDTVACTIAYDFDYLCTEDRGRSAKQTVFDPVNISKLSTGYGLNLLRMNELASVIKNRL